MVSIARAVLLQSKQSNIIGCNEHKRRQRGRLCLCGVCLPSLSVTNDQLTLTTANGHQGIDGLDTSLHGLAHRHTWDDAGGLDADTETILGVDGTFAIDGITQSIDNTAEQLITDWDVDNGTGTLDNIALLDELVVTEDHNTNVVGLQVEGHALQAGGEFHHLIGLDVVQAIDTSDTITNAQHTASFFQIGLGCNAQNSLLQNVGDLRAALCAGNMELTGSKSGSWVRSLAGNLREKIKELSIFYIF